MMLLLKVPVFASMQLRMKYDFFKHLLMCIIIYSCCLSGCQGEGACRPCDNFPVLCKCATVLAGSPTEFRCTVENLETSLWRVQRTDNNFDAIAQSGVVYSHNRKKFNLYVNESIANNSSSYLQILTLNETTVDDDGMYRCEQEGQISTLTSLIVEVPPVIHLKKDNAEIVTDIDVVANKEVMIECVAEGGKPPVTLSWEINGKKKTGPFIDDTTFDPERMVTSVIYYLPTEEDNTLACVTSGQETIPDQKVLVRVDVQYPPNCLMVVINNTNAFVIRCSCKANPQVSQYEIYVNGSLFSEEKEATLPSEKSATVFCRVTNGVESFATEQKNLKPFHEEVPIQLSGTSLVIGLTVTGITLFVLTLIAVLAVCMYRKKKKDAEDTEQYLQRKNEIMAMADKNLPEDYDNKGDERPNQGNDEAGTDGKQGNEEGSSSPPEKKFDWNNPVTPSPEKESTQEKENLIDNADKGAGKELNKKANDETYDQNAGNNHISTPGEESIQEQEWLINSADTA